MRRGGRVSGFYQLTLTQVTPIHVGANFENGAAYRSMSLSVLLHRSTSVTLTRTTVVPLIRLATVTTLPRQFAPIAARRSAHAAATIDPAG